MTTQTIPQQAPQAVRWTRAEFAHLVRAGLLAGRRVELIEGEILEMPAMLGPHRVAVIKVGDALRAITGTGHFVQQQVPLAVGDRTEPEPDAAVVPGAPDDYLSDAPHQAVLVVEISDTTLEYDRGRKQHLYARARFAEYWIVNLVDRVLEIHREPVPDLTNRIGWSYARRIVLGEGETATPLAFPAAAVAVRSLLPRAEPVESSGV